MSLENQELRKIFADIQAEFIDNRDIEIRPVEGDPPSQYEVTYHIPCTTQDEQDNIILGTTHTVLISIPFGFPHFPPSCKPKSAIFHPDFDKAAISLGDFWHRDRTLPELITHIGDMLAGKVYSLENAFNEEAAIWFLQNQSQLPFTARTPSSEQEQVLPPQDPEASEPILEFDEDSFDFADNGEDQEECQVMEIGEKHAEQSFSLNLEAEENERPPATAEDNDLDFLEDFRFSDEISESSDAPTSLSGPTQLRVDTDKLNHLARRKNFCQLDTELTSIPADTIFAERQELTDKTASALQEAQKLYAEAEEYEDQGLADKACTCFKAVESLVADYPNIKSDILRTEEATAMLSEVSPSGKGDRNDEKPEEMPQSRKTARAKSTAPEEQGQGRSGAGVKTRRSVNVFPYVLAGVLLAILAPLSYFYFTLNSQLTEARRIFSECTTRFAAKDFVAAEKACRASLSASEGIYLMHQSAVAELQTGIRTILDSDQMQQGLQGKVLYNERYISKSTLPAHQSLQEMIDKGKGFLQSSSWDQAASSLQKALELSRGIEDYSPEERTSLEQDLNYAAFRSMLSVAESQVDSEDWQQATATLAELRERIDKLSPSQQVQYRDYVENLLAKSQFTSLKEQADTLFSQSDWEGAATLFQKAVEAGRTFSEMESKEIVGLKANISRAELYSTIDAGNNAFSQGRWDGAIESYDRAIGLMDANPQFFPGEEIEQSRQKLQRLILQSAIIRDRQSADRSKAAGDTDSAQTYLRKVVDTIKASDFADDPEFGEIVAKTLRAQQELKETSFIEDKQQYLVNNFVRLFMENYPAATPESLSDPSATFEKRLGRLYLFKLQCMETGKGRPLKLIMFYTYDPDSGNWRFSSEN